MIAVLESLFPAVRPLRRWRMSRRAVPTANTAAQSAEVYPVSARRVETQRSRAEAASIAELAKDQIMSLGSQRGQTVECLEGTLWITFDYDPRDVVVEAGQSYVVAGDTPGWVQALSISRIRTTPATVCAVKAR